MPHMQDPFFGKSVVFICEHTKDGAMGLIVNHPFKKKETKALFTNFYEKNIFKTISTLYFGGPVLIETGIVLHSSEYKKKETTRVFFFGWAPNQVTVRKDETPSQRPLTGSKL